MLKTIITVIQVIAALFLVAVVLLQSGKSSGISAISGGSNDTFLAKNKSKSMDAKLARWTKWVAIAFMALTLVLSLI